MLRGSNLLHLHLVIIGHLKSDGRLDRNYLTGRDGDRINAILAGAAYNYRLVLKWLRFSCAWIRGGFLGEQSVPLPARAQS